MIVIKIPNNNTNERKYILDIIINEFLGLDYELVISDLRANDSKWKIELNNGSSIIFEDHFFKEAGTTSV